MTDYLPGSIKHLNMLLGEQLTEGEGGGGGSSDFSTAEVTVVNNTGDAISAANMIRISDGYIADAGVINAGTDNITAVLYKNTARWMISTGTVTATGNATIETSPRGTGVIITGDCTITIS